MSFTVSLHKDENLTYNVKYRNNFSAPALYTTTAVNIGNFSNFNLYCDNSLELACGELNPPISTYERATECNYIKIVWNGITTIGLITDWDYVNDSNVRLSYVVDAYMSAQESGFITDARGICERTNLVTTGMFVNLQSEPFSPSDVTEANPELTACFNQYVQVFENVATTGNGLASGDTCFVLTVSPAIIEYLGASAFTNPGHSFTPQLKTRGTLSFYAADSTVHAGGTFRGTPLRFENMTDVQLFIKQILSGCGFRTTMNANGWSTQQMQSYRQYVTDSNTGAGQAYTQTRNSAGDPIESIRFITINDIYNLYCIPKDFAQPLTNVQWSFGVINGFKSLATLHKFGGENDAKAKLLAHPFYYNRIVTANGDTVNIIPQSHWLDPNSLSDEPYVWLNMRFIGGDSPRLMGMILYAGNESATTMSIDACCEWFTIRNYPAVTLSINDSFNPQIQKDVANIRKVSTNYINSVMSARMSNPIRQGYLDSVNGLNVGGNYSKTQSGMDQFGTSLGGALGSFDSAVFGYNGTGGGVFEDKNANAAYNENRSAEAGNFISSEQYTVMGNDFLTQFAIPSFAAYDCGATDAEMFAFSRYLDEFGAACNCYLNPITNDGNLFGGNATVTAINGKTFYQFGHITITGNMPIQWKSNIKALFESGVYLLDN